MMNCSLTGRLLAVLVATTVTALFVIGGTADADHAPLQGFGASTPGGSGGTVVRVTNLNDSGLGSLRDAVSQGGRLVVFDVAGDIDLSSQIRVRGASVTVDGLTAPAPGITLRNHGLVIHGSDGAHDVIVRGLRVRDAQMDGMHVIQGAYNVVIDHVSIHGSGDGNLDIGTGSYDVTVSWSIFAEPALNQKNSLIKYDPARVTLHHNLFIGARQRNPQVKIDDAGTPARDTTVDMRNNIVWDWSGGYGTKIWFGPRANVVNNVYSSPGSTREDQAQALRVENARAYVAGNLDFDPISFDINSVGNEPVPFPAPPVDTDSACAAAHRVLAAAGRQPLDAIDVRYVSTVLLPLCPDEPSPSPAPVPPPGRAPRSGSQK